MNKPKTPDSSNSERLPSLGDPSLTISLLRCAHSPDTSTRIYTEKIRGRPLHLKPTEPNPQLAHRQARLRALSDRKKKQKPRPLSARQKRALCLYDIPKERQKYEIYEGLHRLWVGYMHEILFDVVDGKGGDGERVMGQGEAAKMCAADFHGAEVEVVRSRCVSRVGVKGIVVRDSKGVFVVVTKGNQVKTVPKEGTIFRVIVPRPKKKEINGEADKTEESAEVEQKIGNTRDVIFELHGNQFQYRAADRANRKFKTHFLPDL
ncbi:RNase P/MRP, p29 subunit [Mollisia scopiformis]|uniref:Ribonuclease P protein subunit n=1 Tax=Mollisia scopiformis TaxID=149040 RepID=A0A194X823_MOLSC|nr:RNase P/MRP, p29 subunit [Mollisia scopiformis]KUJ16264.1 RNase P/MRP, p29 subunit [Mollisia scopiformis]